VSTDTTASPAGLTDHIRNWAPAPVEATDRIAVEQAQHLAATLDRDETFQAGDPLPLLWHWVYFSEWPATSELGADGHPGSGSFMPPIPNRRRMFAGGRLTVHAPLRIGETTHRRSEMVSSAAKHGRTGEMLFVTIRDTFRQGAATVLEEERDLVYRSDTSSTTSFTRAATPAPAQAPWHSVPQPDPPLLFRFSALTSNAHRIHYDERYATGTEGFPALVVHGPLLAIYMAGLLRTHGVEQDVRTFEFRLRRPVFLGDPFVVEGTPTDGGAELSVRSGEDDIHASASVGWR